MKRGLNITARWLGLCAATALACAKPVAPEELGGNGGPGAGPDDTTGSTPSDNAPKGSDPGDAPSPDPTEDIPGVDAELDVPPAGCEGGFSGGALQLTLDADVFAVRVESVQGTLVANGAECTDAAGDAVPTSSLASLEVSGGATDATVILELGSGDFANLLAGEESIAVALGGGNNALVLHGTDGADHFQHGMRSDELVLDLAGDGRIALVASGVSTLGLSLGAGDDRVGDLSALVANPSGAPPGGAAITPLAVSLVAFGAEGDDWIVGGALDDELAGGPGDDTLSGLAGNDVFRAAPEHDGTDIVNGGADFDEMSYELRAADLSVELCLSPATLGCSPEECECLPNSGEQDELDSLINVESVIGGSGDDTLIGTPAADSLSGGPGDDSLYGLGGSDILYGQRGQDTFDGGGDGDYCDGQPDETMLECEL